jgi:hypothetical protein
MPFEETKLVKKTPISKNNYPSIIVPKEGRKALLSFGSKKQVPFLASQTCLYSPFRAYVF